MLARNLHSKIIKLLHFLTQTFKREQLFARPSSGSAFEGFVIEEIIQGLQAKTTLSWHFNYYRTRGGADVDLMLCSPLGVVIPVEIKFGIGIGKFIEI